MDLTFVKKSKNNDSALMAAKQVPHGGTLVDLMTDDKDAAIAKATVELEASDRQLCDVELIMNGGFSPLTGFMDEATYNHCVENMELPDGTIFGLPVVFDTDDEDLQQRAEPIAAVGRAAVSPS